MVCLECFPDFKNNLGVCVTICPADRVLYDKYCVPKNFVGSIDKWLSMFFHFEEFGKIDSSISN